MTKPKDRLRTARANAGFESPSDAARAYPRELNVNTLISHENGNRDISRKAADKYGRIFGVSAGWILFGGDGTERPGDDSVVTDVPRISWISAGQLTSHDGVEDFAEFPTEPAIDLPDGDWICLTVDGNSMNKISPPESLIFVNTKDKRLVPNACYVVADETGAATYKRFRPNEDPPFQPASYEEVPAPAFKGAVQVIGRVRRSIINM